MKFVIDFIIQLLSNPAILLSLYVMAGMLVRKKDWSDIITSMIKTILGYKLISGSGTFLVDSLGPLNSMTSDVMGFTGIVASNEGAFGAAGDTYGVALSGIIVIAMFVNLLLARFTKFSFIFLTGHEMMWIATCCAFLFTNMGFPTWQVIVAGGLVCGAYMAVMPSLVYEDVCEITQTREISIAHSGTFFYWIAGRVGKLFGDKSHSTEDMNIPEKMRFLRDWNVSLSLVMFAIYVIVSIICLIVKPEVVSNAFGAGTNFIIGSINYALEFTMGIFILMAGVRMVVGEITPSFQGLSEKLVPNAVAGLDIPVVFPYYPTGVLVSFFVCTIAYLVAFVINIAINQADPTFPVVLPSLIGSFYLGATYGCVANATGGRRGAILAAALVGFVSHFVPALLIKYGSVVIEGITFGNSDAALVSIPLYQLGKLLGPNMFYFVIAAFLAVVVIGVLGKKKNA